MAGNIYFVGEDRLHGRELWQYTVGTPQVSTDPLPGAEIWLGGNSSLPRELSTMGDDLFWRASDSVGDQRWYHLGPTGQAEGAGVVAAQGFDANLLDDGQRNLGVRAGAHFWGAMSDGGIDLLAAWDGTGAQVAAVPLQGTGRHALADTLDAPAYAATMAELNLLTGQISSRQQVLVVLPDPVTGDWTTVSATSGGADDNRIDAIVGAPVVTALSGTGDAVKTLYFAGRFGGADGLFEVQLRHAPGSSEWTASAPLRLDDILNGGAPLAPTELLVTGPGVAGLGVPHLFFLGQDAAGQSQIFQLSRDPFTLGTAVLWSSAQVNGASLPGGQLAATDAGVVFSAGSMSFGGTLVGHYGPGAPFQPFVLSVDATLNASVEHLVADGHGRYAFVEDDGVMRTLWLHDSTGLRSVQSGVSLITDVQLSDGHLVWSGVSRIGTGMTLFDHDIASGNTTEVMSPSDLDGPGLDGLPTDHSGHWAPIAVPGALVFPAVVNAAGEVRLQAVEGGTANDLGLVSPGPGDRLGNSWVGSFEGTGTAQGGVVRFTPGGGIEWLAGGPTDPGSFGLDVAVLDNQVLYGRTSPQATLLVYDATTDSTRAIAFNQQLGSAERVGNEVIFAARDVSGGGWRIQAWNGQAPSTLASLPANPGFDADPTNPLAGWRAEQDFVGDAQHLFFVATDVALGQELHVVDRASGALTVVDLLPGPSGGAGGLAHADGRAYWLGLQDPQMPHLWSTSNGSDWHRVTGDGLKELSLLSAPVAVGDQVFFIGQTQTHLALFQVAADGVSAVRVLDFAPAVSPFPMVESLVAIDGDLYFVQPEGVFSQVWRYTPGVPGSAVPLTTLPAWTLATGHITQGGDGQIYFSADDEAGDELWVVDAAAPGGARRVADLNPGHLSDGYEPSDLSSLPDPTEGSSGADVVVTPPSLPQVHLTASVVRVAEGTGAGQTVLYVTGERVGDLSGTTVVTGEIRGITYLDLLTGDFAQPADGADVLGGVLPSIGEITLTPGLSQFTLGISLNRDALHEGTEAIELRLTGVTGGVFDPQGIRQAVGLILDDDSLHAPVANPDTLTVAIPFGASERFYPTGYLTENDTDADIDAGASEWIGVNDIRNVDPAGAAVELDGVMLRLTQFTPGFAQFEYRAVDSTGRLSSYTTAHLTLDVAANPDRAPVANADALRVPVPFGQAEQVYPTGYLMDNDSDPDVAAGESETFGVADIRNVDPAGAAVVLDGTMLRLTNLETGFAQFEYRLRDSTGLYSSYVAARLDLDVAPDPNRPPVAVADQLVRVVDPWAIEHFYPTGYLMDNDSDPDIAAGEPETLRVLDIRQVDPAGAGVVLDGTMLRLTDLTRGFAQFEYRIADSTGLTSGYVGARLNLQTAHAPQAQGEAFSSPEDTLLSRDATHGLLANDSDPDAGAVLQARLVTAPTHGFLTLRPNGSFEYRPHADFNGSDAFSYVAVDELGSTSAVAQVALTVTAINDAPRMAGPDGRAGGAPPLDGERVSEALLQPDGRLVLVGSGSAVGSLPVQRLLSDGRPDDAYGLQQRGWAEFSFGSRLETAEAVLRLPDGKLLVVGQADTASAGNTAVLLTRYTPDGLLDTGFGQGGQWRHDLTAGVDRAMDVVRTGSGQILLAVQTPLGGAESALLRLNADSSIDSSFGIAGLARPPVGAGSQLPQAVVEQADGRLLLLDRGASATGSADFRVTRFGPDGSLDTSYGQGGVALIGEAGSAEFARSLALQADGKLLVVGQTTGRNGPGDVEVAVARLNVDGTPDVGFGIDGLVRLAMHSQVSGANLGIAVQPDGKLLVAGNVGSVATDNDVAVARLLPDGTLDSGFGVGGIAVDAIPGRQVAHAVLLQPDGRIVMAADDESPIVHMTAVRFEPDGRVDRTFGAADPMAGVIAYTEGSGHQALGTPVPLNAQWQVLDPELAARGDYSAGGLRIERAGGANADDHFVAVGAVLPQTVGASVLVGGVAIGHVVDNSQGRLHLRFNADATQARVDQLLQSLAYTSPTDNPPPSIDLIWSLYDGNNGSQGDPAQLGILEGRIRVLFTASMDNPIGQDDVARGPAGQVLHGASVLANDSDPDGDQLFAFIEEAPAHGSVVLRMDGTFDYTPAPGFSGSDSFRYLAADRFGLTQGPNGNTVHLTIEPDLTLRAPTLAVSTPALLEGDVQTLTITPAAFGGDASTLLYRIDWGDGTPAQTISGAQLAAAQGELTHPYADDPNGPVNQAALTLTVTVSDPASGQSAQATQALTIEDLAPSVGVTFDNSVIEHDAPYTLTVNLYRDGAGDPLQQLRVRWDGDLASAQAVSVGGSAARSFGGLQPHQVQLDVVNDDGTFTPFATSFTTAATVGHAAPNGTPAQWLAAWTDSLMSFSHKANADNAAEAWTPVTLGAVNSGVLPGGDLYGGLLGVSGRSANTSSVRQEIDGTEALRIELAAGTRADSLILDLARLFTNDAPGLSEAATVQLYDGSTLVGSSTLRAANANGKLHVELLQQSEFTSVILRAGVVDAGGLFQPGGLLDANGGDVPATATTGSDFLVEALQFLSLPDVVLTGLPDGPGV